MTPEDMPKAIVLILIASIMIVALIPEVRNAVVNATNITGGAATVLSYIGLALVAGFTLLIVSIFLSRRGRTRFLERGIMRIAQAPALIAPALASFASNTSGITLESGIYVIITLAIVFIFAIALLDELAGQIANATGVNGSLEGTIEGTLLDQWVLVIVAAMILGTFAIFLGRKARRGD